MIYQLRVSLPNSGPEVWRRVLVPGEITLGQLHWIVQKVMGWTHSQSHVFTIGDKTFSNPELRVSGAKDENKVRLDKLVRKPGQIFQYEYDPRDRWLHSVEVESITEQDKSYPGHPVCLAGGGACPAENSGGLRGYYEMLKALADPSHRGHKDAVLRVGQKFDPGAFLLDNVNRALRLDWRG